MNIYANITKKKRNEKSISTKKTIGGIYAIQNTKNK